jgi:hypothetical protein
MRQREVEVAWCGDLEHFVGGAPRRARVDILEGVRERACRACTQGPAPDLTGQRERPFGRFDRGVLVAGGEPVDRRSREQK